MPRRNNRDKRFDPKDNDDNQRESGYSQNVSKPYRKRKDKGDKKIYRDSQ